MIFSAYVSTVARCAALGLVITSLVSCGGSKDSDKPGAPTGVVVTPADSAVIVTFDQQPGVTYWIFSAQTANMSRDNFDEFPQARIKFPANSPQIIDGLNNGSVYSFVMNATRDGGPAGPATTSIAAVPRLAGSNWTVGVALPTDLFDLTFNATRYIAVGRGGAVFVSSDLAAKSGSWISVASGSTQDLHAVATGTGSIAVGVNGIAIKTADAGLSWVPLTTNISSDLNDIAFGAGAFVAVGEGGSIIRSTDANTWTTIAPVTAADLYGVNYVGGQFIATGANGSLLSSVDGVSWTVRSSGVTSALRSAAFGAGNFVVVGDNGSVLTSPDLVTWTARNASSTQRLNQVLFGSQFIAVGEAGTGLASIDAIHWTPVSTGTSSTLRGLLRDTQSLGYVAVGDNGVNITAR